MSGAPRLKQIADEIARYRIVDMHQHIGSWGTWGGFDLSAGQGDQQEFDARFEFMAGYGIDVAVLQPNQQSGHDATAVAKRNDDVAAARAKHRDKFAGAMAALPLSNRTEMEREWDRIQGADFCALTFHPRFAGRPVNTPLMEEICARAEGKGWPVLMHAVAESALEALWRLDILARKFPKVKFVALAAMSSANQTQQILDLGTQRPNLYFDTACMFPTPFLIAEFCKQVGSDRLLFGSDLYTVPRTIFASPTTLFEIIATQVPAADKQRILAGNANELFRLPAS